MKKTEKTIVKTVLGSKMELCFSLKLVKKKLGEKDIEHELNHAKLKADYVDILRSIPRAGGILIIEGVGANKESKLVEVLTSNFDLREDFKNKTFKVGEGENISRLNWIAQNFQNKTFKKLIFQRGYQTKIIS
jgi:hypothetical protein